MKLPSALEIRDPLGTVRRFVKAEYGRYDALSPPGSGLNELSIWDILLCVMENARISGNSAWDLYSNHRTPIEQLLAKLAADSDLAAGEPSWPLLEELLAEACRVRRVGLAVATKILHKKRPALIPILDSVLLSYYHQAFRTPRWPSGYEKRGVRAMKHFRADLVAVLPELQDIQRELASEGFPLSTVRTLDVIIWTQTEPRGYYRDV